jgi:hypothetical protein
MSEQPSTKTGLPQGSTFGPLLFRFIQMIATRHFILFTDDATIAVNDVTSVVLIE